jgi:hypothetical protein
VFLVKKPFFSSFFFSIIEVANPWPMGSFCDNLPKVNLFALELQNN